MKNASYAVNIITCQFSRIEICGGISAGKTTLASRMALFGIPCNLERFRDNPFWRQFYKRPRLVAFETEITFLMQHYNQIKMFPEGARLQACDFSFYLDRAYIDVTLSEQQRDAFIAVYDQAIRELGTPSVLVYLRCGENEQLRRVRRRRRDAEKGITLDYLHALNRALESHVSEIRKNVNVVEIDSEIRDFARDEKVTREVLEEIYRALGAEQIGDVFIQGGYPQPR